MQKGTIKIGETSSLIRNMYISIYIVIRTNQYIVIHALRGVVYYYGDMEYTLLALRSAYHNTLIQYEYNTEFIQHGYTTCQYNKQLEKSTRKEKLALIKVIKGGTYIRIGLGPSLHSLTKQTRRKEEGSENRLSYRQENK